MSGLAMRAVRLPQSELTPLEEPSAWDLRLLVPALALVSVGVAMVFSAGMPYATQEGTGNVYYYLLREAVFVVMGLAAMLLAARLSMARLQDRALFLLGVTLLLLVGLRFFGVTVNGARSWYLLPLPGFPLRFQPSEMAKLVLVIAVARYFAKYPRGLRTWRQFAPPVVMLGMICLLIAKEPDLGTVGVIGMAMLAFFHLAGAKLRHVAALAGGAAGLVALKMEPYQWQRILDWILHRPGSEMEGNYQLSRALIALGSGGVAGRGYCDSIEKYFYLPETTTDAILAVIGEELGVVATWLVVALFAYLVCRGMHITARAGDRFSGLVAAGITCLFGAQALLNIAVVTGCAPTTGITLPLVSYGGSSLLFTLVGLGLLLNISRHARPARPRRSAA